MCVCATACSCIFLHDDSRDDVVMRNTCIVLLLGHTITLFVDVMEIEAFFFAITLHQASVCIKMLILHLMWKHQHMQLKANVLPPPASV